MQNQCNSNIKFIQYYKTFDETVRRDQIDQNISIVQEMNDIVSIYVVRTIFTGLTRFIPMKNIQTWQ